MNTPLKVFITGASSGIGLALAKTYAQQGAILGLTVRDEQKAQQLQTLFSSDINIYLVDVTQPEQLQQAANNFIHQHGCPDVVIANAGISIGGETSFVDFEKTMQTNYLGMVACFMAFIPFMKQLKQGTLVGIASLSSFRGMPGSNAYSASKAAVLSYLEALRIELKPAQIKVLTIVPGFVQSNITKNNRFYMPCLMDANQFAKKAIQKISYQRIFTIIPWPMYFIAKLLQCMPHWLFDYIFSKTPRKS